MKRVLLLSLGLMFMTAGYLGCLPSDSGSTTGTAGTSGQGTAGSSQQGVAGTQGSAGNGTQGTAGNGNQGSAGNGNQGTAGDNNPGSAGNTQGSAGNGNQGSAGNGSAGNGSAGNGSAGNGSAGNGSAGNGNGGRGGTNGTAGNGTGGRGGAAGNGSAGSGGRGGTTGTGGSAGTTGTGGSAGTTGTGGTTGNPVCDSVMSILDGFEYLLSCGQTQNYSPLVCQNPPASGQTAGTEYLTNGTRNLDKTMTVAGNSSQSCTITLHVQGVVEPKHYNNCTTYWGKAQEGEAYGPANGMTGCYPSTQGAYNVYMMQVCDNTNKANCTSGTRYYWNAINESEAHFSYKVDYTTTAITIKGGQTLWFLADDSNNSAIKNCDATSVDGSTATSGKCNPITISGLVTTPGPSITQPYNGQFIVMHVTSAQ